MVYDQTRGVLVLFGGAITVGGPYQAYGDTWEWDGVSWARINVSGPAARWGHMMAYDTGRNRVVLFGGFELSNGYFGDTWEYDGTAWTRVATTGPSPRALGAFEYDRRIGRSVMIGGLGSPLPANETWEWDGAQWTRFPGSGPGMRYRHDMAFDRHKQVLMLFGGFTVGRHVDPNS